YGLTAVFDVNREVAATLADELGCVAADSPAGVTAVADVILTVVSDDASMRSIFSDEPGSLLGGAEGRIFINCATVTPSVHSEVASACEKAGAVSLEACMASSITQARQ